MARVVKKYQNGGKEPQLTSIPEGEQEIKTLLDYLAGKYHPEGQRSAVSRTKFSFPKWYIPKKEISLGTDESGKKHTLSQGFSLKQPLQLEKIDIPLSKIESSDTGDIDIRDIIRSESISLPKGKEPQLIMKSSNKTRTGQEPAYYTYWDKDKKQWKRRPVEKEESDRYMRENRIRNPQVIKASF